MRNSFSYAFIHVHLYGKDPPVSIALFMTLFILKYENYLGKGPPLPRPLRFLDLDLSGLCEVGRGI